MGVVVHSYSAATIVGDSDSKVGGLVGINEDSDVTDGTISECYATGTVSGGGASLVGGLVGYSFGGNVSDSYATGVASGGNSAFVGGLIGTNANNPGEQSNPRVATSYSTCAVSGGSGAILGDLIGEDLADLVITNSYWDLDTSGISDPSKGAGNVQNDPGITGLTDAQLKSGLPSGFSPSVWKEKSNINSGYPYLIANPPQ